VRQTLRARRGRQYTPERHVAAAMGPYLSPAPEEALYHKGFSLTRGSAKVGNSLRAHAALIFLCGRPLFLPFTRDARAFVGVLRLPPRASQSAAPVTSRTRPGSERQRPSASCRARLLRGRDSGGDQAPRGHPVGTRSTGCDEVRGEVKAPNLLGNPIDTGRGVCNDAHD
jgi:hypothetical protein